MTIRALACLSEARGQEAGHHIPDIQDYVEVLARYLANNARFAAVPAGRRIDPGLKAATLHDVGKFGTRESIRYKPCEMTHTEFAVMVMHPEIEARRIERAIQRSFAVIGHVIDERVRDIVSLLRMDQEIAVGYNMNWQGRECRPDTAGDKIPPTV